MHPALCRDHSNVLSSRVPQTNDLACERIVSGERAGNLVKHWLGQGGYGGGPDPAKGSGLRPVGPGLGSKLSVN